jgi:hypothetical protein
VSGGDYGVWSVCKVAHVSHCAGLLADSLADSKQVGVRVVVTAASGRGRRPLQTPKSASERIATRLTNPLGRQLSDGAFYDLEAVEPLLLIDARDCDNDSHDGGRRHA